MFHARPSWAFVLVAVTAMPVYAQTSGSAAASGSLTSPAELTFRSTFDSYQRFTDEKVGSWRDANDTVGRIGGWRAYAKEGQQPSPQGTTSPASIGAPSTPGRATAPAAAPAANPHEGHGKQ